MDDIREEIARDDAATVTPGKLARLAQAIWPNAAVSAARSVRLAWQRWRARS